MGGAVEVWRRVGRWTSTGWLLAGVAACASVGGPEACEGSSVPMAGSVCLELDPAAAAADWRPAVEDEVARTLGAVEAVMPVRELRIVVIPDRGGVIPEVGLGGRAVSGREVRIFVDSRRPDVEEVLRRELFPMLAHELHHAMRARSVGYGATLLEAAVSEGLADRFSVEVAGIEPPPWSSALAGEELDRWVVRLLAQGPGGYDHAEWFFGTGAQIPRWTGYAVGFELVGRYLRARPGARPSALVATPAAEIVAGGL